MSVKFFNILSEPQKTVWVLIAFERLFLSRPGRLIKRFFRTEVFFIFYKKTVKISLSLVGNGNATTLGWASDAKIVN